MNDYTFDYKASSDKSEIVARIKDGKNKGKPIYLNDKKNSDMESNKIDLLYDFLMTKKYMKISQKKINILVESVINETEPEDNQLKLLYNEFMKDMKDTKEILLRDSELEIVPYQGDKNNIQRDVIFLAACSGAGKTTFIINYCLLFNKLYPKSKIFLFSSKPITDEEGYKKVKYIHQVNMDNEFLQDIIDNGNYLYFTDKTGQSLVLFDDYDAIPKKQAELLDTILNSILQTGRSKRIYCVVSKHILNAGVKTKIIWSESNKIVLFPNGLSRYSLVYAMKNYLGLDIKTIDKLLASRSRWVCIHTHLPKYYITQNSLSFIK